MNGIGETTAVLETGARAWAPRGAMDRALQAAPVVSAATRPHVGAVVHCEGPPPSLERVAAHVGERLGSLPALRSVPAGSRWRVEPGLHLRAHVVEQRLEPGEASLAAAVGALIGAPLPAQAPPWQLHLLHGRTGDGFALLYRVHHSLQDGGGVLHTLETLFADDAGARSSGVYPGFAAGPRRALLRDMGAAARLLLGGTRRAGSWASYPAGFSGERMHRWREVPLSLLRTAARNHGATVNDVFLAALAHAVARTGERLPSAPAAVPFLVPVNLRRPHESAAPGNRVVLVSVAVPGGGRGAAARLAATPAATGALRSPDMRETLRRITALTPAAVMTGVLRSMSRPAHSAALASNLGACRPLRFQSGRVTRVEPLIWAPTGVAAAAVLLTHRDTGTVGFTLDPAMPGLGDLPALWQEGVESLA